MPLIFGPTAQGTGQAQAGYDEYNRFKSERYPTDPRFTSPSAGPSNVRFPAQRFPSARPPRSGLSSRFYGSGKGGVLQTGFGVNRPKLLSMRRFTSKWSPGGPGQLLQPNPAYMGGAGNFDPRQAARMGMGRMPGMGTYGSYMSRNMPFMRPTV